MQHAHYAKHCAAAQFLIIQSLHTGKRFGRLYVNDAPQEIGLMEITLATMRWMPKTIAK